jgi:AcrR family transcriptional regulator
VLTAALQVADLGGIDALTMRRLGQELGVEAMALYHHFANKEDVLDGIIDLVFAELPLPPTHGTAWQEAMRSRGLALKATLARHPWAIGRMESRTTPGPANLRHHDAVLGCLRAGGFSVAMAAHAYSVIDSYVYGFALTKMNLATAVTDDLATVATTMLQPFDPGTYPHLVEFIAEHALQPGYNHDGEFEYGLDLVLEGLQQRAQR